MLCSIIFNYIHLYVNYVRHCITFILLFPSELLLKAVQRYGERTKQASLTTSAVFISFMHAWGAWPTQHAEVQSTCSLLLHPEGDRLWDVAVGG